MSDGPAFVDDCTNARILVVDDDEANVALLRHLLARSGYRDLHTERDSSRVLQRFEALRPDAVLLDLHLPPPDGLTLLAQLQRRIDADDLVPVLVLTADASAAARRRALAAGAHDFITKPFDRAELALRLRNSLTLQARHRALQRHAAAITAALHARDDAERAAVAELQAARARIETVLNTRGLAMAFQPVVDLPTGEMIGAEALARFLIEPHRDAAAWFAEAADVSLAIDLEVEAVRAALERLADLPGGTFLSINASARTIASPQLAALLDDCGALERLVIELTEHEQVQDYARLPRPWPRGGC
ncbi:MAG: response regulator [Acidimicrobiales bacterium]